MSEIIVVKSQETRNGCQFRCLKDGTYLFYSFEFNNYFYVKEQDYYSYEDEFLRNFKFCIKDCVKVDKFIKIILSNNFMRTKVRNFWEEHCHTFEADIKANKRFLLDNKMELFNTKIPYTFYDIETDDRLPLNKDDRGKVIPESRILSFAAVDNKGESVYFELEAETDDSERKLLQEILEYFSKYGIISGWNSEFFDSPYIKGRCDTLGVDYGILDYINHLDYMDLFKKYDKKSRPSYSLNNISNEVLNESKVEQSKGNGAIYNTWKTNKEHLKKYNIEDANLIYKINKKRMFIEVSMKRADNAGCHVRNTVNNSDSGDYLLMRAYKAANIIMPSQPTKEEAEKRKKLGSIGGGYTTCFKPGFHKQVKIFDFKSEYPSVIQTWNISPETYIETIEDESVVTTIDRNKYIVTPPDFEGYYRPSRIYKKEEGIIPKVVRWLVEERDKIKYTMGEFKKSDPDKYTQLYLEQYALKTDSNSIYGILAFPMSRYFSWELGDSVTTCARATLKHCNEKIIEKLNADVIGGDTDSTFIKLDKNITTEMADKFFIELLDEWGKKWGSINNKLVFEYEKTFKTMLFVKKKHYGYLEDDKITIKGMEAIKSDTNPFAAKLQREFIHDVLLERYNEDEWRNKINSIYNKVFNQELTSAELILVKALTKMPKEYEGYIIDKKTGKPKVKADGELQRKAIPAHVKLAERLIEQGKEIYPGSKIHFIVIKDKPILAISVAEYEKGSGVFHYKHKKLGEIEYEWEGDYDAKYYWLRITKPLIKVIYSYYGEIPEWDWNLTNSELNKILKSQERDEEDD